MFTDRIEKFIPPKKGKAHILRLVREILGCTPEGTQTSIRGALEYLNHVIKKRSISFVISDFIDKEYENALRIVSKRHDVIAVTLEDPRERDLPKIGMMKMRDAESAVERWIDSNNIHIQQAFRRFWTEHDQRLERTFLSTKVDRIKIEIHKSYIQPLVSFFRMREARI
jgi:uncharacterized protein (DUF58 family)